MRSFARLPSMHLWQPPYLSRLVHLLSGAYSMASGDESRCRLDLRDSIRLWACNTRFGDPHAYCAKRSSNEPPIGFTRASSHPLVVRAQHLRRNLRCFDYSPRGLKGP